VTESRKWKHHGRAWGLSSVWLAGGGLTRELLLLGAPTLQPMTPLLSVGPLLPSPSLSGCPCSRCTTNE